jgi:hypothetical protein
MQPVSLDAVSGRSPGWQAAQRVQFVVAQVALTCAGLPQSEVADVLARRLRGMGVMPNPREVQRYAEAIAALPKERPA